MRKKMFFLLCFLLINSMVFSLPRPKNPAAPLNSDQGPKKSEPDLKGMEGVSAYRAEHANFKKALDFNGQADKVAMAENGHFIVIGSRTQRNGESDNSHAFVMKFNRFGVKQWEAFLQDSLIKHFGQAVLLDKSNNIYVAGNFLRSTIDYGTFFAKYSKNGQLIWSQYLSGYTLSRMTTDDNQLFVAGNYYRPGDERVQMLITSFSCQAGKRSWTKEYVRYNVADLLLFSNNLYFSGFQGQNQGSALRVVGQLDRGGRQIGEITPVPTPANDGEFGLGRLFRINRAFYVLNKWKRANARPSFILQETTVMRRAAVLELTDRYQNYATLDQGFDADLGIDNTVYAIYTSASECFIVKMNPNGQEDKKRLSDDTGIRYYGLKVYGNLLYLVGIEANKPFIEVKKLSETF